MRGDGASKFRIVLGLIQVLFIVSGVFLTRPALHFYRKIGWESSLPEPARFVGRYGLYFLAIPPFWWILSRSLGRSPRETQDVDATELAIGILLTLGVMVLFSVSLLQALGFR